MRLVVAVSGKCQSKLIGVLLAGLLVSIVANGFVAGSSGSSHISGAQTRSATEWNIIDHTCTNISQIPESAILQAKSNLHIAYGHTSHGSQLTTGMDGLVDFMNGLGYPDDLYSYDNGGTNGALDLRDSPFSGASDLGNPDRTSWAASTQDYLDAHSDVNVIIWSWCGQVSSATQTDIDTYLGLMTGLEALNPDVDFVYMTGHLDGSGLEGNLHLRNEQIRNYCLAHDKILYDFTDIETYDPDGTYFGDKTPNDACDYDTNGDGTQDGNWATEWQDAHDEGVDWYDCSAAHSQPLNANRKAYAAWWLWAALAGWDQSVTSPNPPVNPTPDTTDPVARTSADQNVGVGAQATFSGAASSDNVGVTNYTWSFTYNGTLTGLYGASPRFTYWTPGSYQITLTVSDAAGNVDATTMTVEVTENAPGPSTETESDGWLSDYWWLLVVLAVVIVVVIAAASMSRRKPSKENPPPRAR
jgi:hypothetical protein